MLLFVLFVLGAHVGSFLNVCIWRLPRGESVVQPPSHCPNCNTRLQPLDLVPLVSQIALSARCRYCKQKISWRYFGIEFLTGALFVLVGMQPGNLMGDWWTGIWVGDPVRLLQLLIVVPALIVVFWVDYETFLIPISAAFLAGLAGVGADAWHVAQGQKGLTDGAIFGFSILPAPLPESLVAMVVMAALLWLLRALFSAIYKREAMGFGDVFLVAAIAANIGWKPELFTFFFLSVVLGAIIGVGLQIPRAIRVYRWAKRRVESNANRAGVNGGRKSVNRHENKRKAGAARVKEDVRRAEVFNRSLAWPLVRRVLGRSIPFGPMLVVGALVTLLYGARLDEAYMNWVNAMQPQSAASSSAVR